MTDTRALGMEGEQKGLDFLRANGYIIVERNYRTRFGEINLIARDRSDIVFIEVKRRRTAAFGSPFEAVTARKQERIVKSALWYLKEKRLGKCSIRFDVVSIGPDPERIDVIKAAFSGDDRYTV